MKAVLAFATTALVLVPLVILTFQLGWSIDLAMPARFSRPEEPYVLVQDESFRTNDRQDTRILLAVYSDDSVQLITEVPGLTVSPDVALGAAREALIRARGAGLTDLFFTNIEDCAEPFYGQIRITVGYFTKRLRYSGCINQDQPAVQEYHRYLFETFVRRG